MTMTMKSSWLRVVLLATVMLVLTGTTSGFYRKEGVKRKDYKEGEE